MRRHTVSEQQIILRDCLNETSTSISLLGWINSLTSNPVLNKLLFVFFPGLEVIKLEFILRLKIKCDDWLLADTCSQAANHCALF